MIPGDRGKAGSGWLTLPLSNAGVKAPVHTGTIHQFLWRRSRAVSDAKQGLRGEERSEAAPSRVKYSGLVSGPGESLSPRGCMAATAYQHGTGDSGGPALRDQPDQSRRKAGQSECSDREGHRIQAGSVKTFRNAGDATTSTAGL
jgi:hypothetical protein